MSRYLDPDLTDAEVDGLRREVVIQLAPRCRLTAATAAAFGLTDKACRRKIEDGKWLEGQEYHRDPDGNIWLDQKGIMQWVARGRA